MTQKLNSMLKIRCSSLGRVMTNDRSGKNMGDTAKSCIEELFIQKKFGRYKSVRTDEMTKGLECEENSIDLLSEFTKSFFIKNETQLENAFITGTPDLILNDEVWDIKTLWDIFTFHKNEPPINKANNLTHYGWQLMGYMWLTGAKKAHLAYCLVNTPRHLVESELSRLRYKLNTIDEDTNEAYLIESSKIELLHSYDDLELSDRVRIFSIDRDEEKINAIKHRVQECREYYNSIKW